MCVSRVGITYLPVHIAHRVCIYRSSNVTVTTVQSIVIARGGFKTHLPSIRSAVSSNVIIIMIFYKSRAALTVGREPSTGLRTYGIGY